MGIVVLLVLIFLALIAISAIFHVAFDLLLPVLIWMLIGMFAGRIMRGRGYGPIGDILLGLAGGVIGSLVLGLFGVHLGGIIGNVIAGIFGAVVFVYLVRLVGSSKFAR